MHYSAAIQMMQAILKGTLAPVARFSRVGHYWSNLGIRVGYGSRCDWQATLLTLHTTCGLFGPATSYSNVELRSLVGYGLPLYVT